jgi:hypothetical protein
MNIKEAKKSRMKLPEEILIFDNPDKTYHESWKSGSGKKSGKRDLLNIPHPFRAIIVGPPNSGKTLLIKNILIRADPEFQECYVIHCDAGFTKEYEDVNATLLSDIPNPNEWKGKVKTLVILDDLDYSHLEKNKEQSKALNRLFGFCSTHKNISVCLTAQDYFNIPATIKRMSNFFIIWKNIDSDSFKMIARKCGMKLEDFEHIFKNYIGDDPHNSLWIDLTKDSPAKLRKNGYEIIPFDETSKAFVM